MKVSAKRSLRISEFIHFTKASSISYPLFFDSWKQHYMSVFRLATAEHYSKLFHINSIKHVEPWTKENILIIKLVYEQVNYNLLLHLNTTALDKEFYSNIKHVNVSITINILKPSIMLTCHIVSLHLYQQESKIYNLLPAMHLFDELILWIPLTNGVVRCCLWFKPDLESSETNPVASSTFAQSLIHIDNHLSGFHHPPFMAFETLCLQ